MEGHKTQESVNSPKNRVVEILDKNLIGRERAGLREGARRGEVLEGKERTLKYVVGSLAEQFYGSQFDWSTLEEEGQTPLKDSEFRMFVNSFSKDHIVKMLEAQKQEIEAEIANETPNTPGYIALAYRADAIDEVIRDMN